MSHKKPWYDLVVEHLKKAAENRFFPENSVRGEIEAAKIALCLDMLQGGTGIPAETARGIAPGISRLACSLADSRQYHLNRRAQQVADDLASRDESGGERLNDLRTGTYKPGADSNQFDP